MKIQVTMYPYVMAYGEIEVPDDIPEDEHLDYIYEHMNDIKEEPRENWDVDYSGTDIDIS